MPTQPPNCTQYYIHYRCGHDHNSEFIKCALHAKKEDLRCGRLTVQRIEAKASQHKCRQCLSSDKAWAALTPATS